MKSQSLSVASGARAECWEADPEYRGREGGKTDDGCANEKSIVISVVQHWCD